MSTAVEHDPYAVPLPHAGSPVVLPHRVLDLHAHVKARFGALSWPLAALTENPSASKMVIHWRNCPTVLQLELKLAAWTMINGELRPTFLRERHNSLRSRISATSVRDTVQRWMHFATWAAARGASSLAQCGTETLEEYTQHLLDGGHGRAYMQPALMALTRLWAFDHLSARPSGIGRPPWDELGADDYLPAETGSRGENATEPLAEQTMGPLLVWAMRVVDDFADDILAAWAESRRLVAVASSTPSLPGGLEALRRYFEALDAAGTEVPGTTYLGRPSVARTYIAGTVGAAVGQIEALAFTRYRDRARERPGPCPLLVPLTGRIGGVPWQGAIDFFEARALMRHLGTAAFIVCAYLTGMRPGEVLGLHSGCCPDPIPDGEGRVGRHLIRAREFKTARDEHGNHRSAGVERDVPWVAIAPVVHAIRLLERMVPEGHLLFDHNAHDLDGTPGAGSLKPAGLISRIEDFATWVNTLALAHGRPSEVIAPDPYGRVGTGRFRRSLAWHIARRPGGLVALAIQYGHLRTTFVSEGYASRSRGGIHELIDVETVRAVADTVADLQEGLETGGGISGPAARRAIKAAGRAPRFAGSVINATTARRLIANDDALLYDNPHAFLLCHYKRSQALCHRDGIKDTPSLDHCVPGCGNIVRTDEHALRLREHADVMDQRATHTPQPVGDRLRASAIKLRDLAETHERTRITAQEATR